MKQIGIFFGSRSPEHDISIITAMRVIAGFRELPQYQALPVYIAKDGRWFCDEALGTMEFFRDPEFAEKLAPYAIESFGFRDRTLLLFPARRSFFGRRESYSMEMAFPCFHGSFGEDGTVQGLFEMAGVPYIGCGVRASAIGMSKIHTRRILRDAGIPSIATRAVERQEFSENPDAVVQEIAGASPFPLFVKPNGLGSSIAVAKVADEKQLRWALEVAFQFDTTALVEHSVPNIKEVNVAVLGHRDLTISQTEEPRHSSAFQTFEEKYLIKGGTLMQSKGKQKSRIPADIPRELETTLKDAAGRAFRVMDASGIARFDFLVDQESKKWYFGEANTIPGSLQAHLWEASGILFPQLLERLIAAAHERSEEEQQLMRVFSSNVLQK